LLWKWSKGAATAASEFGDPITETTYSLCIYDGTQSLISRAVVPPGGLCAQKPCWKQQSKGFVYKDRSLAAGGIKKVILRAGLDAAARIRVDGRGSNLDMPPMSTNGTPTIAIFPPATVILKNSDGICWMARYNAPALRNTSGPPAQFKDRAD
jgi:hypothetical protein